MKANDANPESTGEARAVSSATADGAHAGAVPGRRLGLWYLLLRLGLGLLLIYMGWVKASDPVSFLKSVRAYGWITDPPWLNLVAAGLPWFEIFCGSLWVLGLGTRGTALVVLGMLLVFTALVAWHALGLREASGLPFCGIRFDCGCGTGAVLVCAKLVENGLLMAGTFVLLLRRSRLPVLRAPLSSPPLRA
ncbi:MAG: DoxX family membrane protein [Verrucomicrobiales bacterium]|nr:DoxX family membrane protein [Verrucomicrobiales bacterium]